MRFYERFCSFRALCIIGKCTSRHLFAYGGLILFASVVTCFNTVFSVIYAELMRQSSHFNFFENC